MRLANHRNNAQGAWKYPVPPDASPQTIDWDRFLGDRPKRAFDPRIFFQWRCWWEFSGGVATDLFVHLLTWLHEAMSVQAPVSVASFGGIWKWNDGRNVPDVMNSIFEYKEGFVADIYVNLCNSYPTRSITVMGSEGSLVEERGQLIRYYEPVDHDVQSYGTMQWPSAMRAAYYEQKGWTANGRPKQPLPPPKQPDEIKIERGPSHAEWFIISLREGKPSRENAEEGHYAAGAAHVANIAYRKGKRQRWDYKRTRSATVKLAGSSSTVMLAAVDPKVTKKASSTYWLRSTLRASGDSHAAHTPEAGTDHFADDLNVPLRFMRRASSQARQTPWESQSYVCLARPPVGAVRVAQGRNSRAVERGRAALRFETPAAEPRTPPGMLFLPLQRRSSAGPAWLQAIT